jgi:hypothetical protein
LLFPHPISGRRFSLVITSCVSQHYLTGADKADERHMLMTLAAGHSGQFRAVNAKGRKD